MAQIKKSIALDIETHDFIEYLCKDTNKSINKFVIEAVNEKIETELLKRRGGEVFKCENPQLTAKLGDNKEVLEALNNLSDIANNIDPLSLGEMLKQLNQFYMQRMVLDEKSQVSKFIDVKIKDEKISKH